MKLPTLKKSAAFIASVALYYFFAWAFVAFIFWDAAWMTMSSARLIGVATLFVALRESTKENKSE